MKKFFYYIITGYTLIVLFNPSVASETNTLIKQATILITAKKIEKAYQLLSPFADDKAGNPEFDYLYGLLLQKKHHYTQAVLVLERALLMRPEHVATQSALAKSYIALKEFKKAEQLQQKLQQEHETSASNEIKTLEEQKKKDEKIRYTVNGFIRSTGGYDDNLTNGPDENFITILSAKQLGTIYVGKGLEKDQDFFVGVSGSLGLKTQFSNNFGINVGIWGSKRFNRKRPDEEIAAMSSSLGGHYQYGHNSISIDLKYQSIWINTLHYQEQYALLGQWYRPLWKNNALALHFNINTTRHPHSKTLDSNMYTVGAIFYQSFNWLWRPMVSLEVYGIEDKLKDSDNAYLGYENIGTRFATKLYFNQKNTFLISGAFEKKYYKKSHPLFLTTREDTHYSMTGKYTHFLLDQQLELSAQATWMLNRSNISLYDYQRNIATLNIQWNF